MDLVADISADDTSEWDRLGGAGHALVVPPLWLDRVAGAATGPKETSICFLSATCSTPNNVEGLRWFTNEVLPILRNRTLGAACSAQWCSPGSEPDAVGSGLVA